MDHHEAFSHIWVETDIAGPGDDTPLSITLELDLDQGTLTIHRDGINEGIMMEGLAGEYCWFATTGSQGDYVTIEDAGIIDDTLFI